MAAKKNDPRREARIAKNNRNLNSALTLFTAGFIAEFYLLLINQYFVKGSVDQVVAIAGYLEVMAIVGAAAFGAGVVLTVMRRKWTRFAAAGKCLLGLGLFFGVSSLLMRRVYPMGTTVMCILVPVLMLLAVVFLLYQHEFAVQTIALTLAIASAVLLNHGSSSMPALVTAFCWAAMVFVAALLVLTVMLQKHEGSYKGTAIFPAKTNYALTCAVLVLSIAAIAVSLFAGLAYYVIWGAAVLLFVCAAVYLNWRYTGGVAVLRGNLAPDTGITKPGAFDKSLHHFKGEAICFDSEEAAEEAILAGKVHDGHVVVIRYEGPKGGPGMREMYKAMKYLYGRGLSKTTALITDGRFSGTNNGCFVGHISPEAAEGGPIAIVHDGDLVEIDVDSKKLELLVPQEEIEARLKQWKRPEPKFKKGWLGLYCKLAASGSEGGVMKFDHL